MKHLSIEFFSLLICVFMMASFFLYKSVLKIDLKFQVLQNISDISQLPVLATVSVFSAEIFMPLWPQFLWMLLQQSYQL